MNVRAYWLWALLMAVKKMAAKVDRTISWNHHEWKQISPVAGTSMIGVSTKLLMCSEVLKGASSCHLKFFFGDRTRGVTYIYRHCTYGCDRGQGSWPSKIGPDLLTTPDLCLWPFDQSVKRMRNRLIDIILTIHNRGKRPLDRTPQCCLTKVILRRQYEIHVCTLV